MSGPGPLAALTVRPAHRPDPAEQQAVRALVAAARQVDGVEALGGHVLESLAGAPVLTVHDGEALVAVAALPAGAPAELVVHPERRDRGIGGALLDLMLEQVPQAWAHGDLPAARALAAGRDLTAVRMLLQLRRPLTDLPSAPLPDGVRIRSFVPGADDTAFLGVNARAFDWHPEQGALDQAGLDHELAQDWFDAAGFLLAVDGPDDGDPATDRVLGFHWTKVHAVDPTPVPPGGAAPTAVAGPVGEVYVIAVDPLSPVRRLGAPLTAAGLQHLADRGLRTVMLYVEGDNAAALSLYRRLGFEQWATDVVYRRTRRSDGAPA